MKYFFELSLRDTDKATGILNDQLSKEFEFHKWADRQRVSDKDKSKLLTMMRQIPEVLAPLFAPRWVDGTLYFSLWEVVIVAKKLLR